MEIKLESYDASTHDRNKVAKLIFESDPVFNSIVYGKNALSVIEKMLHLGDNYFDPEYTRCAILDGKVAAVLVSFPLSEKTEIDQKSGRAFAQSMGLFKFLARMPLFIRMGKMMPSIESDSGSYIHTLSVDSEIRRMGIGRNIRIEGFIHSGTGLREGQVLLGRLLMWCCTADAYTVGFLLANPELLPIDRPEETQGQWFRLEGTISTAEYQNPSSGETYTVPAITVEKAEEIETPRDGYVYPDF